MIKFTAPEDRIVRAYTNGVTERVTEKVTEVTEKVTENEQQILSLLLEDPAYTYTNLSERLSISRKTVSIRIKSLKEKGLIKRIGSDTKGYWEILL
ncbi:MAG: winged helix-turn-helix transcriptional regulator [Clostridiales bacterium]|nr:winged helix-turn-helix transcriptional regulator [Clostridiales bacterium]